jgi:hypothetical protein
VQNPESFTEVITGAARRGLAALVQAHPGERLAGYALCTDDDLRTVYAVGCTREFLADQPADRLFLPTEWPDGDDDASFEEARQTMYARADAAVGTAFGQHVLQSFAALVAALRQLRLENRVGDDVFLVALSTDPGELLTALEDAGVRDLNPAGLYDRWRRATA